MPVALLNLSFGVMTVMKSLLLREHTSSVTSDIGLNKCGNYVTRLKLQATKSKKIDTFLVNLQSKQQIHHH